MATKKKVAKKSGSNARAWEIGSALTAATIAAAAGAYVLSNKKMKAKTKKWVLQARKEVAKSVKTARKLGEKEYDRIVDQTVKRYGSLENLTARDVIAAGKELKGEWKKIQTEASKMAKAYAPKKAAKKKAARKVKPAKKARV